MREQVVDFPENAAGEALLFKPHSWQRGQSGLNYGTISDGLILAEAPYNGAATFNWEASRNKLTKGSLMYACLSFFILCRMH